MIEDPTLLPPPPTQLKANQNPVCEALKCLTTVVYAKDSREGETIPNWLLEKLPGEIP